MSGSRAALKVAVRNARRNRKRTIFLVLLVAVPVALGVVVAGLVRASSLTPAERAQLQLGTADALVHVEGGDEVMQWVEDTARTIEPGLEFLRFGRRGVVLDNFEYATATDLDLTSPLTDGMLLMLEGRAPTDPGEVAVSPAVSEVVGAGIGGTVEFDDLVGGELEVVGLVAEPVARRDKTILLWPGALGDASSMALVGGPNADGVTAQVQDMWWSGGRQQFWPEPAVEPVPPELELVEPDVYVFLTETEIGRLVEIAQQNPDDPGAVMAAASEMVFGSGRRFSGADIYIEGRNSIMRQGGFESSSGLLATGASTLLLIEVAFITGAAFAAGTRRRLREIGLLGSSGASERHIRTTVVGEGLSIGLTGAVVGILLGIAVLVLGRPLIQPLVSRLITGVGVAWTDLIGPVAVALVAVLVAVLIPARTASRIPTTAALRGRMPASPPRRWIIPAGLACSGLGALLVTVAIASTSNFSGAMVGVGGGLIVGGVAMLSSPILAGVSKLADHVPATGRLVLRDSGRHRTRASVAVAAIMVILLAPTVLLSMAKTNEQQRLLYGLPAPANHLLVSGTTDQNSFESRPLTDDEIAAIAAIVPEREVARFETVGMHVRTREQLAIETSDIERRSTIQFGSTSDRVAVANPALLDLLDDAGVTRAIDQGQIVVLGVEDKDTSVSLDFAELEAVEIPVPVVESAMPRVLLPEAVADRYDSRERRTMALFVLDRPLTDPEFAEMQATVNPETSGGRDTMSDAAVYTILAGITLLAVLIVIALVTAVSAAEVDEELATIVAVGAPGSFRRRFLALLTGYQTLIGAALAVPLGIGLMKVFTSAQDVWYIGTFGELKGSTIFLPWPALVALVVATPIVVGLLTLVSVRSAPVTPPRRAT